MNQKEKYLITGFSGFVSRHFLQYLENKGEDTDVVGLDLSAPEFEFSHFKHVSCHFRQVDLLDKAEVERIITTTNPNYILHLASFSSVAYSWNFPANSFVNNTNIFLNLLEAVRSSGCRCRILSVGSSEEYGEVDPADLPITELQPLKPLSPYAVARVSQEMLSAVYAKSYGIDIVMTRSFNHVGTGQKEVFVVPSIARQLITLKNEVSDEKILNTGDTDIVRDFVDVRDVVKAYYLLFKKGKSGDIYNVCSGVAVTIKEMIQTIADLLDVKVSLHTNAALVRPNDNRVIIGDNNKLKNDTGWSAEFSLRTSLKEILDYMATN